MTAPVQLIPLRCLRCETPLPAQPDEVAWVCQQCGQGLLLDEEAGLVPLAVHFAANVPGTAGRPFWVAKGQVGLQRQTYHGSSRAKQEAAAMWDRRQRFFVPAFSCPLDVLVDVGARMLLNPPDLQPGEPVPFAPVTLSPLDVRPVAEFIVMAVEAERKDKLKALHFVVEMEQPELWILP
ncbi:MAG: hypothetical protein JW900_02500 [Anaerolineae bacterium]|nr:hypothetical protein [Anaerolineae bacterium]